MVAKLLLLQDLWKLLHHHDNNIIGCNLSSTIHKPAADQKTRLCRRTKLGAAYAWLRESVYGLVMVLIRLISKAIRYQNPHASAGATT